MYNMTQNRLPAPYELNQPQVPMSAPAQSLARGGRTSKHKMIKVHANPHELRILDHLQGGPEYSHEGIKRYPHLEEIIKNPHIVESIHRHAQNHRQHHAFGGLTPAMEHLKAGGRYGDTELAEIGPHTHRLFNEIAGYPTRNPHTGHPEYFSLGGALSGLWNTFKPALKGIAQAAAPTILPMAQQALGNRFGGIGQMAGNMLSQGVQSALGPPSESTNPMYQNIGQSLGKAAEAYRGGANPSEAFGQGLNNFGSQMGGGIGNALAQSGQSLSQGRGWGESARRGAQRGYDELGGSEGLREAAGHIGQGLMQGGFGGAREAAGRQMSHFSQRALPRPANQGYDQYEESPYQQPHHAQRGHQRYEEPSYDQYEEPGYEMYA
jgi:hypothetical protein